MMSASGPTNRSVSDSCFTETVDNRRNLLAPWSNTTWRFHLVHEERRRPAPDWPAEHMSVNNKPNALKGLSHILGSYCFTCGLVQVEFVRCLLPSEPQRQTPAQKQLMFCRVCVCVSSASSCRPPLTFQLFGSVLCSAKVVTEKFSAMSHPPPPPPAPSTLVCLRSFSIFSFIICLPVSPCQSFRFICIFPPPHSYSAFPSIS